MDLHVNSATFDRENLNVDTNPIVIRKKPSNILSQIQNISLRYLKPPPPPPAGDILIRQESDRVVPAPSPLVIQQGDTSEPITPEPMVYREKPPKSPVKQEDKIVTIPGKIIQKPRKIIIEHIFREVRYEDVPPQLTREQIKKHIQEKIKKESNRPNFELESLSNTEGSTSFTDSDRGSNVYSNGSALLSSNFSSPFSNASASLSSNASQQLITDIAIPIHNSASHTSLPIKNLSTYTPRVNRYSQSRSLRIPIGNQYHQYNDRHSIMTSLSAELVPSRNVITEMDMYDENRIATRFRRVGSLKPHREVSNNLRLLGFAF